MKHRQLDMIVTGMVFTAAACAFMPLMYPLFIGTWGKWIPFLPVFNLLFILLGYFLQSVYARRIGLVRRLGTMQTDITDRGFVPSAAALPMLTALVMAFLSSFLYKELYYQIAIRSTVLYKMDSLHPYLAAAGTFLMILVGIILWFYPPEKLINMRLLGIVFIGTAILVCVLLMFGGTSVFAMVSQGSALPVMSTVCYFIFFSCLLYLLNQVYITRNYRGAVASVITPEARMFNMLLITCLIGFGITAILFVYLIICGAAMFGRMILFFFLYQVLRKSDSDTVKSEFVNFDASGEMASYVFSDSPIGAWALYAFLAVLAMFFVLILCRKARSIVSSIAAWIAEIISFWVVAKSFWETTEIEILNYTDEETKLQKAAIRDYNAMAASSSSYDDFINRLNNLPDMGAKMSFAYSMMLRACRKAGIQLKTSDTPREACEKIRRFDIEESEELTEVFELVKYACQDLGDRTPEAIRSMCAVVKKYMF